MRILYLTHYFPPEGNAPASRVYEMSKRWVRQGHEVTVITCAPNAPAGVVYPGYRNRLVQRERLEGIDVVRVWTYLAANKGVFLRVVNYVSYMAAAVLAGLFVARPDVVIATSPQLFCGWAGAILASLRRLPFVLEIRDIWPDAIVVHGVLTSVNGLLERLARRLYGAARHIVTVGDGYKNDLMGKGVRARDISIVTNGADLEVFFPREPEADLKERYGLEAYFLCSYIGTIGMSHGLAVVLRAARILKGKGRTDIRFLFVGDGAEREALEQEARANGLESVIFLGRQDKNMVPRLLSVSDVCLVHVKRLALYRSVLPSKIFEAWAMAKPVVLGVEGCAAEVVEAAGGGVCVEPENEQQLVAAVESLADDHGLSESLGQAGRDYVVRHFSRDALAKDYLDVLEQVRAGTITRS